MTTTSLVTETKTDIPAGLTSGHLLEMYYTSRTA